MKTYTQPRDVLVVGENGENLGLMPWLKAKQMADEAGLDLVVINSQEKNTVCRIMDEGKWKYEQKKKAHKVKQHTPVLKEMKFNLTIDEHDCQIKVSHIHKFLEKGHSVKIAVQLRGREKAHPHLAEEKLNAILSELGDVKLDAIKKSASLVHVIVHPHR